MKRNLAHLKEQQRQILEESLNEIYMFDAQTLKFIYVNKGALANIGYSMSEMADMTPLDIKPEFDLDSFQELLKPLQKREKEKIVFETYHKRADETLYPVEVHLQMVPEANVFIAIKLDISERKKVEEEREYLMNVLEESLNEIYMFDAKTLKFTYVNKGALSNIGYSMKEMYEMTPLDIKPEFDLDSFVDVITPLKQKEKDKIVFETVHQRADGSYYNVEVHLQLVREETQAVFMAIILDITNRKAFENEILQLNENLEKKVEERTASLLSYQNQLRSLAFQLTKTKEHERKRLASFLHDNLGQFLAISKMELDQIKRNSIPDVIAPSLKKLEILINDAIGYTRQLMEDLKPAPAGSDKSLVSNIHWVAQKMEKYGLRVSIKDDGQPKPLNEEIKTLITQSVRELLFNVVKHADVEKAEVMIRRSENHVDVVVRDFGKGFKSGDPKQGPVTENEGFGLFNLREQMDWLGSSMDINSEPGEGTRVKMRFPVLSGEETIKEKKPREAEIPKKSGDIDQPSKIKVLIADDHQMMRKGLRKMIEEEEDLVVIGEASNGREAVDLSKKMRPDIIIMDINMPKLDGIEATKHIIRGGLNSRIIGLSFHKDKSTVQAVIDAGASTYLSKSEVFETLCATVRSEAMVLEKHTGY